MLSDNIKQELLLTCKEQLAASYTILQDKIGSIVSSLNDDTKNSAGDKHQTSRAMLQIEREQAGERLAEIEKTQKIILQIDLTNRSAKAHLGSLVFTNHGTFFLSISVGSVVVENQTFYCIGLQTPIGKLLLGKTEGESFKFRDKKYSIQSIR